MKRLAIILALIGVLAVASLPTYHAEAASRRQVVLNICSLRPLLTVLQHPGYAITARTPLPDAEIDILSYGFNTTRMCPTATLYSSAFLLIPEGQPLPEIDLEFNVLTPYSAQWNQLQDQIRRNPAQYMRRGP
jgi:hypothetical protein